jgi:DNA-binding IclR family transcriptional regulator
LLAWKYHLPKADAKRLLRELEEAGLIEIVPFHGIRIIGGEGK